MTCGVEWSELMKSRLGWNQLLRHQMKVDSGYYHYSQLDRWSHLWETERKVCVRCKCECVGLYPREMMLWQSEGRFEQLKYSWSAQHSIGCWVVSIRLPKLSVRWLPSILIPAAANRYRSVARSWMVWLIRWGARRSRMVPPLGRIPLLTSSKQLEIKGLVGHERPAWVNGKSIAKWRCPHVVSHSPNQIYNQSGHWNLVQI